VFVLPSLWEGLPNALLEAMVHGKPCVVTAVTGNTEVVVDGQSGLLVPPRDAPAIAQAVVRLIREPDLARSIGRGAAQRVRERFSVERAVRATVELYRNLVGRAADGSRRGCGADVEVR
jgi:glycosyltransferase involved in cell wall biosynthesis